MVDLVASGTPVRTQILLGATPVIAVGIPISINDSSFGFHAEFQNPSNR